ncbi:uncharacterized protein AMSG_12298 [Thecamonas trahens ATCC 50062]|uniref:Uncharacterized protein n=1 Tax=Thecamonas trahens ATCC 50062 TaxID=461836 RepID=A0A0L0DQ13_THETB|nr:hypothetical protein AMSG_12298 [Thecamonas trahens ATCC 50062]KNC54096.1 hypothetical protein AMSG_12298 [Thecamonas trahens ATCC 50062]|eukprot:XP_013754006.1 hypothetical protein AMSG_12298 [Thecamonas trahens ATCC 50062]
MFIDKLAEDPGILPKRKPWSTAWLKPNLVGTATNHIGSSHHTIKYDWGVGSCVSKFVLVVQSVAECNDKIRWKTVVTATANTRGRLSEAKQLTSYLAKGSDGVDTDLCANWHDVLAKMVST